MLPGLISQGAAGIKRGSLTVKQKKSPALAAETEGKELIQSGLIDGQKHILVDMRQIAVQGEGQDVLGFSGGTQGI